MANKSQKKKNEWKVITDNYKYDKIIAEHAEKWGVDPDLVKSIINVESSFKPNAVSAKNCKGLMQLSKDATSTIWGVQADEKWRGIYDPDINIETGTKYIKKWLNYYEGDVNKALADYNWGHGNLRKWLEKYKNDLDGNLDKLPKETREYFEKYKKAKEAFDKQKSEEFGECHWITKDGRHICIENK